MIPGFATAYKDKNNFVHLYFFKGIGDDNLPIYNDIDLNNITIKYSEHINIDGSKDLIFYDKNIIKLNCKLIDKNNKEFNISLKL